jgi:hypothetical protein
MMSREGGGGMMSREGGGGKMSREGGGMLRTYQLALCTYSTARTPALPRHTPQPPWEPWELR